MSHFTVMVIDTDGYEDTYQDMLEPYDEGITVATYLLKEVSPSEFQDFRDHYTSSESTDYSKRIGDSFVKRDLSANVSLTDKELYDKYGQDWNSGVWKFEDGKINEYSTYNPKAKWDWYVVGGRWDGFLLKKDAKPANLAVNRDVDWEKMLDIARNEAESDWEMVAKKLGVDENGVINQPNLSWETCLKQNEIKNKAREVYNNQREVILFRELGFGFFSDVSEFNYNKEDYINLNKNNGVATFAVLLDGVWYEKGKMLLFGISGESKEEKEKWDTEFYSRFIEPLNDNAHITIVDCHI